MFAPAAKRRAQVVPARRPVPELNAPQQLSLFDAAGRTPAPADCAPAPQRAGRHPWAWLLRRVFAVDVTVCERCQGRMRIVEVALTQDAIARVSPVTAEGPSLRRLRQQAVPGQLALPGVPIH